MLPVSAISSKLSEKKLLENNTYHQVSMTFKSLGTLQILTNGYKRNSAILTSKIILWLILEAELLLNKYTCFGMHI